jgi:hypothetical protein
MLKVFSLHMKWFCTQAGRKYRMFCIFLTLQLGVVTLLEIIKKHVSAMSREDLESVQDALWTLFCQHLLNVRNDCSKVSSIVLHFSFVQLFTWLIHVVYNLVCWFHLKNLSWGEFAYYCALITRFL